jgi:hypothetical protein
MSRKKLRLDRSGDSFSTSSFIEPIENGELAVSADGRNAWIRGD